MLASQHNIQGHYTQRRLEYLINPVHTTVIASDLTEPGYWPDPAYDLHINHCVQRFIEFAESQPVFVEALHRQGVKMIMPELSVQPEPTLVQWCEHNNVEVRVLQKNSNYDIYPYAPPRHAFVFGIHADICVQQHIRALTSMSAYIRGVIMMGATYALYPTGASGYGMPNFNPQCDALGIHNCEIVK
jgi:hypothetical protein